MTSGLRVGHAVTFTGAPGIGRIGEIVADRVRIDFFESAAEPVTASEWVEAERVRRVRLGEQTRVFFIDGGGRWRAGRVISGGLDNYFVRVPNAQFDFDFDENDLRVRWEKPPKDPLQVLLSGANETPRFRDVREPVRRLLVAERAATGSATGIMSSGVQMHAHQINAALRIIRDPIQRYLLADEVGMGKTIQAGLVMRQVLHDAPGRRVGVLVPDALDRPVASGTAGQVPPQRLPDPLAVSTPCGSSVTARSMSGKRLGSLDLLVVDEAHLLARTSGPAETPYKELAEIAHAAPRLLMLSATPFSRGATTHLALLHLLDPALFRWDELAAFEHLLESRHALALAVFGLDEEPDVDNPELLQLQFDQVRENLPDDEVLQAAIDRAMAVYGPEGTPPEDVDLEDAPARGRGGARTRFGDLPSPPAGDPQPAARGGKAATRRRGLLTPFEFTGRSRPKVARSDDDEIQAGVAAVAAWASRCADAVLDDGIDPARLRPRARVLYSRLGGSIDDVCAVLAHRLGGDATSAALLPAEQAALDAAPVLAVRSRRPG